MDKILSTALKRIAKDAGRSSKFRELKQSCVETVEAIGARAKRRGRDSPPDRDADKYFLPLQLACASRHSRIICTALDCVQKLMAHGFLRGAAPAPTEGAPERKLVDVVVDSICRCNQNDDAVQLQVIKALLTAVTCSTCEVHGSSLLAAVRACYEIHLSSRNTVNKTTAKATLTQMLNVVFQLMERWYAKRRALQQKAEGGSTTATPEARAATAAAAATTTTATPSARTAVPVVDFCGYMYPAVSAALGYVASGGAIMNGAADEGEGALGAVAALPAFESVLQKDAFLCFRVLCKLSMKRRDSADAERSGGGGTGSEKDGGGGGKENGGGGGGENGLGEVSGVALRSKVLSLELLLSILDNSGAAFRSSEHFVFAVRQYLVTSLVRNCSSTNTQLVGLSLRIFVIIHAQLRDHLKGEIELFLSGIFLRILESPNSESHHKPVILVLEVFTRICQDVQSLVELFINYDCDLESIDLFARIVNTLTGIATHPVRNDVQALILP